MKSAYDVIIRPVISEKSTMDAAEGKYTFVVARTASKPEIRQACEKLSRPDIRLEKSCCDHRY